MTVRRVQTHKECLEEFSRELKRHIDQDLRAWRLIDREQATNRAVAYATVIKILKRQAERHGVPASDLGLVDYEVPPIAE